MRISILLLGKQCFDDQGDFLVLPVFGLLNSITSNNIFLNKLALVTSKIIFDCPSS